MTSVHVALIGAGLFALSGALALVLPSRLTATVGALAGAIVAFAGFAVAFGLMSASGATEALPIPGGTFRVELDALGAMFLPPIGIVGGLGGIYATRYWADEDHPRSHRVVRFTYGLMAAAMCGVVLSHSGVAFLFCWEVMALAAFVLIATEHERQDVRDAAFVYLVATHVCTLGLWVLFAQLEAVTGEFGFATVPPGAPTAGIVLIALGAFGIKAGIMPLHVWLPSAHASAPTHVSAFLSGVLLKMGVYGLVRVASITPGAPPAFGYLVVAVGAVSAIGGVAFALGQHDLKRLLAYHSIENIGIILLGLGLALVGRSEGHPSWVALGLAGALLHVWNHATFKALLFFAGGAVIHSTGTRVIDQLGGLARRMPRTAAMFAIGAVAICGLPPLNGFVSEILIYLGVARAAMPGGAGMLAIVAPALALVGAMALACFIKVYGVVFLGEPRSDRARDAQRAPHAMVAPMAVLAAVCVAVGLLPVLVSPALDRAAGAFAPEQAGELPSVAELAPLWVIGACSAAVFGLVVLAIVWARSSASRRDAVATWGCAYPAPTSKLQYTATSFASSLVAILRGILRPRTRSPQVIGVLPGATRFEAHVDDAVLEGVARPVVRRWAAWLNRARWIQAGHVQLYVLLVFGAVLALIASMLPVAEAWSNLWAP